MPRYKCRVLGCENESSGVRCNPRLQFFSFPEDPQLAEEWVLRCGQPKPFKITSSKLCFVHFAEDVFDEELGKKRMRTRQKCLKRDSVPTLFLPDVVEIENAKEKFGPKRKRGRKKIVTIKIKQEPEDREKVEEPQRNVIVEEDEEEEEEEEEKAKADIFSVEGKKFNLQNVKRSRYCIDVATPVEETEDLPPKPLKSILKNRPMAAATTSNSASTPTVFQPMVPYSPQKDESGSECEDFQSQTDESVRSRPRATGLKRRRRVSDSALDELIEVTKKQARALLNISYSNAKLMETLALIIKPVVSK